MVVVVDTGERVNILDLVTTLPDICERFNISRSAVVNWMYKDRISWVKVGKTILIDVESFINYYEHSYYQLDADVNSK